MAMKACGTCFGRLFSGTAEPPMLPRVASIRPLRSTILMVGGRLGISSDWIGGRCAPTQITPPIAAITSQRPATAPQ